MSNRLSHSQVSRYQDCPQSHHFHYKEKFRPKTQSSALLFGTAIDKTFESCLKKAGVTPECVFDKIWSFQEVNGKETFLPDCIDIVYSNSDFDKDLLNNDDHEKIKVKFNLQDVDSEISKIYSEKEYMGFDGLPDNRKLFLNYINWLCMYNKGLLMIEALQKKVMPNIEEVLSTQEKVELKNEDGDTIIGYVDLVAKWKGHTTPIILDLKTSSREYDKNAVPVSPQLSLYVHALSEKYKTRNAGYVVLLKNVKKNKTKKCPKCGHNGTGSKARSCDNEVDKVRCKANWDEKIKPEIIVQVLIDEISDRTEEIVLQNYDYINQSIKNGVVYRNLQSCIKPWGPCTFYSLCYYGKEDDLVKV